MNRADSVTIKLTILASERTARLSGYTTDHLRELRRNEHSLPIEVGAAVRAELTRRA